MYQLNGCGGKLSKSTVKFTSITPPDGTRIVSGGKDGALKVWDAKTGKLNLVLRDHEQPVQSVAFSPDGSRIISGSRDGTVKVWLNWQEQEKAAAK